MDLQKRLYRPVLPRRIGVITAERGAARDDLVAGLERRGWSGEIVWGFAPVQDRKAAPEITRILSDMAAFGNVETIVVSRGGGSLTDLWAFCDETLCRTVALLGVPVVSAVGHERDETLIDDVAAARCSTPTHAADEVIRVPRTPPLLQPLLTVVPLQVFALHLAMAKGLDADQPRNLAKSVTVE